jgi:hypothetical protein
LKLVSELLYWIRTDSYRGATGILGKGTVPSDYALKVGILVPGVHDGPANIEIIRPRVVEHSDHVVVKCWVRWNIAFEDGFRFDWMTPEEFRIERVGEKLTITSTKTTGAVIRNISRPAELTRMMLPKQRRSTERVHPKE